MEDLTGHSTKQISTTAGIEKLSQNWYMVYTDEEGVVHTVKGTIKGIRRSFKEGLLGDAENVRVAQRKTGPFEPLRHYPEFRDLVVQPGKMPTSDPKTPKPAVATPPAAPAKVIHTPAPPTSGSDVLATTIILTTSVSESASAKAGPTINLRADDASLGAEIGKWIVLGLVFAGVGVAAAYLPPFLRNLRAGFERSARHFSYAVVISQRTLFLYNHRIDRSHRHHAELEIA